MTRVNKKKKIIAEQNDKGEVGSLFVFAFFIIIVFVFAAITNYSIAATYTSNVQSDILKGSIRPAITGSAIDVAANVLLTLGMKEIDKTARERVYTIFGNKSVDSSEGFILLDYETREIIYRNMESPGDGVVVTVPAKHKSIFLLNNH